MTLGEAGGIAGAMAAGGRKAVQEIVVAGLRRRLRRAGVPLDPQTAE